MKIFIKPLLVILFFSSFSSVNSSDFKDALGLIEVRKIAMQNLWYRIKRLSPYVELKEKVDYDKKLASEDAEEVFALIKKTKNMWNDNSNLSAKGFTNATPAVWALPIYFEKIANHPESSNNLS